MTARSYAGHWWIGNDADHKQPGILQLSPGKWPSLNLIGGFDLRVIRPSPAGGRTVAFNGETRRVPVINGLCGPLEISLLDCRSTSTAHSLSPTGPPHRQTLEASQALIGARVSGKDAPIFSVCILRVENFHSLLQAGDIAIVNDEQRGGEYRVALSAEELGHAEFGAFSVSATPWSTVTSGTGARSTFAESQVGVEIRIEAAGARSYDDFGQIRNALLDLVTLASDRRCGVISEVLILAENSVRVPDFGDGRTVGHKVIEHDVRVEVDTLRTVPLSAYDTSFHPDEMLFTSGDLPFEEMCVRWLSLRHQIKIAANMLFGLINKEPAYVQTQLLVVAVATEAMSRELRPNAIPMPPSDFERLLHEALKTLDPGDRERFGGLVRNEPTYRDRLLDVASIPAQAAVDLVIPDREQWVGQLRDVRNGLAHGLAREMGGLEELHRLYLRTRFLLYLVMMSELGLAEAVQVRAVRANESLMHANRST